MDRVSKIVASFSSLIGGYSVGTVFGMLFNFGEVGLLAVLSLLVGVLNICLAFYIAKDLQGENNGRK